MIIDLSNRFGGGKRNLKRGGHVSNYHGLFTFAVQLYTLLYTLNWTRIAIKMQSPGYHPHERVRCGRARLSVYGSRRPWVRTLQTDHVGSLEPSIRTAVMFINRHRRFALPSSISKQAAALVTVVWVQQICTLAPFSPSCCNFRRAAKSVATGMTKPE